MALIELDFPQDGVAQIRFNRPETRNALNWEMIDSFSAIIDDLSRRNDLVALLITGAEPGFIAGADLKMLAQSPGLETAKRLTDIMGSTLKRLSDLPCISIAVINGSARGGGAEIALACDLRVMAEDASISFVHASLGLIPGWGGGLRLYRQLGYSKALELLASTKILDAAEANEIGLVNRVVRSENLQMEVESLVDSILQNDHEAVSKIKSMLRVYNQEDSELYTREIEAFIELWGRDERLERFDQFKTNK